MKQFWKKLIERQKPYIFLFLVCLFSVPSIGQKIAYISPYNFSVQAEENISCPNKPEFLRVSQEKWCEIFTATHNAVKEQGLETKLGYKKAMTTMLALIYKESSFRDKIVGKAGEIGLTQIMPSTGRFICQMNEVHLFSISNNLNCSAKYLNMLLSDDYFANDLNNALMAYNQGWGNVKKGIFFQEDIQYVNLIKNHYSNIFIQVL